MACILLRRRSAVGSGRVTADGNRHQVTFPGGGERRSTGVWIYSLIHTQHSDRDGLWLASEGLDGGPQGGAKL